MHFFIVIYGPTASGKTDYALELAHDLPVEIINADVGQLYTPLSIGTAKPDWKNEPTPHHMFDMVNGPQDYSAYQYQRACLQKMQDISQRGNIPLIVGGSGFYIKSLFFPPRAEAVKAAYIQEKIKKEIIENAENTKDNEKSESLWQRLYEVDAARARMLHPHDTYRIERALALWQTTGVLPSLLKPEFHVPAHCLFIFLDRDRDELAERINKRVDIMMNQGWLEEVQELYRQDPAWCEFLGRKGLMGYSDLCEYLQEYPQEASATGESLSKHESIHFKKLVETIKQKTREYARRQRIFWRSLRRELKQSPLVECQELLVPVENSVLDEQRAYIRKYANKL